MSLSQACRTMSAGEREGFFLRYCNVADLGNYQTVKAGPGQPGLGTEG